MAAGDTTVGSTPSGTPNCLSSDRSRWRRSAVSVDLSNWLRLPLHRFLTSTPYGRKCLVPCGEDLRVWKQIVEHVLPWTNHNHTFALGQYVAPTSRKDRVRYLGKNNDRISCREIFTILSGDPAAPARHLAEVKHRDVTISPIESNCSRYPRSSTRRAYLI